MLDNLNVKIRECYWHAEECERRAKEQSDAALRDNFLDAARHWIVLAQSSEFTERLARFTTPKG